MKDPLGYFSLQPELHNLSNKGSDMCYLVWDGVYKRSLAANWKVTLMWW